LRAVSPAALVLALQVRLGEHADPLMAATDEPDFPYGNGVSLQEDLRQQIGGTILERASLLTADTVAIFPYSGTEPLEAEYCSRVGQLLVQLIAMAVREGRVDARSGFIADLHRMALERMLTAQRLFTFVYLLERTILDELALSDTLGATVEPWPIVAQLVRRASIDLLAAYTDRVQLEPADAAVVDRLTTLYTRAMMQAVLGKQLELATRFGHAISLILFDVDNLSHINREYGYGVGDRLLERLGILIRKYFRQHDWVARHFEDAIAVLLTHTDADQAVELAERVRVTVAERLGFTDHRTDRMVEVTISGAVVNVKPAIGQTIDTEHLVTRAEEALERAKERGRNRIERVDGYS
jgi:diguanylate cyclase (GGDEF)-like protein